MWEVKPKPKPELLTNVSAVQQRKMNPRSPMRFIASCIGIDFARITILHKKEGAELAERTKKRNQKRNLCLSCIRSGHAQSTCPRKRQCPNCEVGNHNILLCFRIQVKPHADARQNSDNKVFSERT